MAGKAKQSSKSFIGIGGFLGFAVVTYVFYTSTIIAAQDILAATSIPTSSIVTCLILPYVVLSMFFPFLVDKTSLMMKACMAGLFWGIAIIVVSLTKRPSVRLVGVVVASLGMGTAEIGFLSATSLHGDLTIHSFTCGTGVGAVLGTGYFTVVTTVCCLNPKTALLLLLVLVPVYPLLAWMINRNARKRVSEEVEYTRIGDSPPSSQDGDQENDQEIHPKLTWTEKFKAAKDSLHLAVPLTIGLFADYLIMQAVVTTLAFKNTRFDPRDHFQYYTFAFWFAELFGRSYGLAILSVKPSCSVVTKHTWILSSILSFNLIFLILASWYRFVPHIGIIMLFVIVTGATEGALYLNTFAVAGKDMQPRYREFSRAFLTFALTLGIVIAALMGLWVERVLQEHCAATVEDTGYCFTRSLHGWNATSSCLLRKY
ncbi:protein BTN1 [Nematostella vectensis]|uniref:protein BTN1 n=1 Tax=Nematostella vectensis TaxID=45351 RepID=UPI0020779074|nr:protein BTN1 [Nematostella vectensis]